jgi:hypothetical protein
MTTETRRYRGPGVPFQGTIAVRRLLESVRPALKVGLITIWRGRSGQWHADTDRGPRWVTKASGWKIHREAPSL